MKIYYVYHSCFIVETRSSYLMFDYFKHEESVKFDFNFQELLLEIQKSNKKLYVFASHSHRDHFNEEVLSFSKNKVDTYYVLSSDINIDNTSNNIFVVKNLDFLEINNIKVNAFGSTDEGVSFLVNVDGFNIFHAGDLNWWHWMDDTKQEEESMENSFKAIIEDIINLKEKIDIAFFPLDGRLKKNYKKGADYFIDKLVPQYFFPMHFWNKFSITKKYKSLHIENIQTKKIELNHSNEVINI